MVVVITWQKKKKKGKRKERREKENVPNPTYSSKTLKSHSKSVPHF